MNKQVAGPFPRLKWETDMSPHFAYKPPAHDKFDAYTSVINIKAKASLGFEGCAKGNAMQSKLHKVCGAFVVILILTGLLGSSDG
jgi:hypothetical protein